MACPACLVDFAWVSQFMFHVSWMDYSKLKMVWNWFHTYCLTNEFSVLPCSSMFYDMSSHPSLNHIHQAEGPGEVKRTDPWCPGKKTNDRLLEFSSQPYLSLTHTYIYIHIHDLRRGFRFPRTSRNLQSCDTIIHVWSSINIQKGGWVRYEPPLNCARANMLLPWRCWRCC